MESKMQRRFLIIDDDTMLSDVLSDILIQIFPDSEVDIVETGEEGIEKAIEIVPTVILLDLMLPNINGYEVCERIKANETTQYIPVIIVTGLKADYSVKSQSLNAGADAFLSKPFDIPELTAQIKAMVRLHDAEELVRKERDSLKNKVEQQSELLNLNEERLQLILQNTNDGILDWDIISEKVFYSEEWIKFLGFDPEDINESIEFFYQQMHNNDLAPVKESINNYLTNTNSKLSIEFRMINKSGNLIWVNLRGQAIYNQKNQAIRLICVIDDITHQKDNEKKLEKLAHHDTLTGLPNRILMKDRIELSVAQASRNNHKMAVLFLDLDGFKFVNDNFGHNFGDVLLQQVSQRLLQAVRELDTVARFGGDEFVIVLQFIDNISDIHVIAKRIVESVARPYIVFKEELNVTTSLGISIYPDDCQRGDTLLKYADMAMYNAKNSGKNQYCFFASNFLTEYDSIYLFREKFAKALDTEDIFVDLQPVIDVGNRSILHFEALMRWRNEGKILLTNEFLPMLESTDVLFALFQKALKLVISTIREWKSRGLNPVISINVSEHEFYHKDFFTYLSETLLENQISGYNIALEVNENTIIKDIDFAIDLLTRLGNTGINIILDDFGIGFISLKNFARLPISAFKIAPEYIQSIGKSKVNEQLIRTIIVVSRGMKIQAIAKGIETKNQLDFLVKHKIKGVSGFLIHRPMENDAAYKLLKNLQLNRNKEINF
jgi:diguanylate cyclase (GGDEF)-like protein/PAS domain S-box-containing protein